MILLGTNEVGIADNPINFKSYYKKTDSISECGKKAVFVFKRDSKYRFVTVPKSTKYDVVVFNNGSRKGIICDYSNVIKNYDNPINVLCFDRS